MADKYTVLMQGQRDGMSYALKIAKEQGIEALEKECDYRNAVMVPIQVPTRIITDAENRMRFSTLDTVIILAAYVLYEHEGFSYTQIQKFITEMEEESGNLQSYADWQKYIDYVADKTGIELRLRRNDKEE